MELKKVPLFLVSVFLTLSPCTSLIEILHKNKEMVYSYESTIKAGTEIPESYASQFTITGKLHLQISGHTIFFQLKDLHQKIHNGATENENSPKFSPIPTELSDMSAIFKADYETSGKVKGIYVGKDEKEYVRNMKKALVAIWQMDATQIFKEKNHHAFITEEHSIYGLHNVYYNVLSMDENITVHKMHELPPLQYWKHSLDTTNYKISEAPFKNTVSQENHKTYILSKENSDYFPSYIESQGAIYYYPHHAHSDVQYLSVNQTFKYLTTISQPTEKFTMKSNEHFIDNLKYSHHLTEDGPIYDLTNGRMNLDETVTINFLKKTLQEIWKTLEEDPITIEPPNPEKSHLINQVYSILIHFDLKEIEKLHATLEGDQNNLKVFYNILPLIGTEASMSFIKKLIMEKKLQTDLAVQMVEVIGNHMLMPNRRVIKEFESLILNEGLIDWELKKYLILTFGSMLHRCYIDEMKLKSSRSKSQKEEINMIENYKVKDWEYLSYDHNKHSPEFFENYINVYLTKIKNSNNYEEKLVYMHGLHNMKIDSLISLMADGINGKLWNGDKEMRLLSMLVVKPLVHHYPDEVFKIFWPIWTDVSKHKELRMVAFWMIMESIPSQARLWNMYWHMQHEYDLDLYHFYYTYFKSIANSKEPALGLLKIKVSNVLRYMSPPVMGTSICTLTDFEDLKYTFGYGFKYMHLNSEDTKVWVMENTKQYLHTFAQYSGGYVKVTGLNDELSEMFLNMDFNHMSNLPKTEVKIDVVLTKNENVVFIAHFDKNSISAAFDILKKAFTKKDQLYMNYASYVWNMVPTDMGFPATFQYFKPIVHKYSLDYKPSMQESTIKFELNNHYKTGSHWQHGLGFYNPYMDAWQGINRYHTIDYMFPMYMTVSMNYADWSMKVSFKTHDEYHMNVIGLRSHVQNVVYAIGSSLNDFGADFKKYEVVGHGPEFKHNYTLYEHDDILTGYELLTVVYDIEGHVTKSTSMDSWFMLSQPYTKNFQNPWDHLYLTFMNWKMYTEKLPSTAPHGIMIHMAPSTQQKVTSIDLNINYSLKKETTQNTKHLLAPQLIHNTQINYAIKSGEQTLNEWDLDATCKYNHGHTQQDTMVDLTYKTQQNQHKINFMGTKQYFMDNYSMMGHWNVTAKGEVLIDVQFTGELSEDQKEGKHLYGACQKLNPYEKHHLYTMDCLKDQTSLRKYHYDVKVKEEELKMLLLIWEMFKGYNLNGLYPKLFTNHDLNGLTVKIDMVYPMKGDAVDVQLQTENHLYEYEIINLNNYLSWFGVHPESMFYNDFYNVLYSMDLVDYCWIHHEDMVFNGHKWHNEMSKEWMLYVGSGQKNSKHAVFVKVDEHTHFYSIKFVEDSEVLEVHQMEHGQKFIMNGNEVPMKEGLHFKNWISFGVLTEEIGSPIIVNMHSMGIQSVLTHDYVWMTAPKSMHKRYGQCYNHETK